MNITLPREQQEWLEAQVRAGAYESIDEAVASIVAEHMQFDVDDLEWAKPLVEEARAAAERGETMTLEEYRKMMDERFGNTTWDQRENYVWRGAALHSLQEIARELASHHPEPTRAEALAAATVRLAQPWFGNLAVPAKPRNIYVMVLESFWDPSLLTKAGYSEPPFDPRFEALWEQAGVKATRPAACATRATWKPPVALCCRTCAWWCRSRASTSATGCRKAT